MKYFYLLFLFIASNLYCQTQIFDKYPSGQHFYDKGELNFLKSLQEVALENDVKPCDNKSDFYELNFIVYSDKTIKFIKDSDTISVGKSKCAYEFAKKTFKHLKEWTPLILNGQPYSAAVKYSIYPADILAYKINDDLESEFKQAEYPGGHSRLSLNMEKIIQSTMSKYQINLNGETVILNFKISKSGLMYDFKFSSNIPFTTIDDLKIDLKKLNKWKPATKNGVAVESNYRIPMTFTYPF